MPRGDSKRFVIAAQAGDLETLQDMHLKFDGMIVNRILEGKTALHEACRFGHKAVIEWLLDIAKADVEIPDESTEGFRAIHWAANVYLSSYFLFCLFKLFTSFCGIIEIVMKC